MILFFGSQSLMIQANPEESNMISCVCHYLIQFFFSNRFKLHQEPLLSLFKIVEVFLFGSDAHEDVGFKCLLHVPPGLPSGYPQPLPSYKLGSRKNLPALGLSARPSFTGLGTDLPVKILFAPACPEKLVQTQSPLVEAS